MNYSIHWNLDSIPEDVRNEWLASIPGEQIPKELLRSWAARKGGLNRRKGRLPDTPEVIANRERVRLAMEASRRRKAGDPNVPPVGKPGRKPKSTEKSGSAKSK